MDLQTYENAYLLDLSFSYFFKRGKTYIYPPLFVLLQTCHDMVNNARGQDGNDNGRVKRAWFQGPDSSIANGKSKKQELSNETVIYAHFCKLVGTVASFAILGMVFKSNDWRSEAKDGENVEQLTSYVYAVFDFLCWSVCSSKVIPILMHTLWMCVCFLKYFLSDFSFGKMIKIVLLSCHVCTGSRLPFQRTATPSSWHTFLGKNNTVCGCTIGCC